MAKQLIVFDVDGVLLFSKMKMGGFKDILSILGKSKEVEKIDEEYQKRKHLGPWGIEQLASQYKGFSGTKLRDTAAKYCQVNLTKGAKDCVFELKREGYIVGAISSNPQFIMDSLDENLSLDFSEGTKLEFKGNIATGKLQRKVDRYVKAEILQAKAKDFGLKKEDIIVVGDSITDLPMAELAGTFIAFQPKDEIVKERATKIVENFQQLKQELLCG